MSFEEIVRLSRLFAGLGVRKLRLTGGEPLLRANLSDLIGDLTGIPGIEDIALTIVALSALSVSLDTKLRSIFIESMGSSLSWLNEE